MHIFRIYRWGNIFIGGVSGSSKNSSRACYINFDNVLSVKNEGVRGLDYKSDNQIILYFIKKHNICIGMN